MPLLPVQQQSVTTKLIETDAIKNREDISVQTGLCWHS